MKLRFCLLLFFSLFLSLFLSLFSQPLLAMGQDDPWLSKVMVHELQYFRDDGTDVVEWDMEAWLGQDLHKFWLKTEGEYASNKTESGIETGEVQLLHSRAVSAYWDRQMGIRHDFKAHDDGETRTWLGVGYIGMAPGFWEVDATLFVGEQSSTQLRLELERELMLTQYWVLTPDITTVVNGKTNRRFAEGSGLSEIEAELRLGYEFRRQFQLYVGVSWSQRFGATKRIFRSLERETDGQHLTIGFHGWF